MKTYIKMTYFQMAILVMVVSILIGVIHPYVSQYTSRLLDGDSDFAAVIDTVWQQESMIWGSTVVPDTIQEVRIADPDTVSGITSAENEYRAKVVSERLTSADGIMPDTVNGIWATASGFDPNSRAVMTYIDSADDYVWPEAGTWSTPETYKIELTVTEYNELLNDPEWTLLDVYTKNHCRTSLWENRNRKGETVETIGIQPPGEMF